MERSEPSGIWHSEKGILKGICLGQRQLPLGCPKAITEYADRQAATDHLTIFDFGRELEATQNGPCKTTAAIHLYL
jgi:hypothetical protein